MSRIQGPARLTIARFPALRRAIKSRDGAFRQPRRYDAGVAKASLEVSLAELGTDYIDTLFLHDPADRDDVELLELGAFFDEARQAGQIRAWGVAGDTRKLKSLMPRLPADAVLQLQDDIFNRRPGEPDAGQCDVTFGVLSSALGRILAHLQASDQEQRRWTEVIGLDCSNPDVVASLLLCDALQFNDRGIVLFGTTRPDRIGVNLAATKSPDQKALEAFQGLVTSGLVD
jgi:D-threo-aldose 1-dehydrogenase